MHLLQPGAAILVGNAARRVLLLLPPDPEAEHEPAVRDAVDGGCPLGQHRRVVQRGHDHCGAEPQRRRCRGQKGQQLQGIRHRGAAPGSAHAAFGVVGIEQFVLVGDDHVLDGIDRLDPAGLEGGGVLAKKVTRGDQAIDERRHHAELYRHGVPPTDYLNSGRTWRPINSMVCMTLSWGML